MRKSVIWWHRTDLYIYIVVEQISVSSQSNNTFDRRFERVLIENAAVIACLRKKKRWICVSWCLLLVDSEKFRFNQLSVSKSHVCSSLARYTLNIACTCILNEQLQIWKWHFSWIFAPSRTTHTRLHFTFNCSVHNPGEPSIGLTGLQGALKPYTNPW